MHNFVVLYDGVKRPHSTIYSRHVYKQATCGFSQWHHIYHLFSRQHQNFSPKVLISQFPTRTISHQSLSCQNAHSLHLLLKCSLPAKMYIACIFPPMKTFWREDFGGKIRKMHIVCIFPPKCFPTTMLSRQNLRAINIRREMTLQQETVTTGVLAGKVCGGNCFCEN